MIQKHKKDISIDALAGMIQRGFEEVKKEQNKVEQNLRKEMHDMEKRIAQKFIAVDLRFDELEGKIETYTSFWHRKFSEHEIWLQNLDRSVASIERQLKK